MPDTLQDQAVRGLCPPVDVQCTSRVALVALCTSSPQSATRTLYRVVPLLVPTDSIFLTTSSPAATRPNTTCRPSKCGVGATVRKNCDPFVFRPAFAMDNTNGCECGMTPFSPM